MSDLSKIHIEDHIKDRLTKLVETQETNRLVTMDAARLFGYIMFCHPLFAAEIQELLARIMPIEEARVMTHYISWFGVPVDHTLLMGLLERNPEYKGPPVPHEKTESSVTPAEAEN